MRLSGTDTEISFIWSKYRKVAKEKDKNVREVQMERFAFYERSKSAYAIIATGEELFMQILS